MGAECGIYTGCPLNGGNGYKRDEYVKKNRHNLLDTYFNGNSWYTVLCLPYTVRLTEYSLFKQTDIDCSRGADCLQTEVLVAKLFVDTECEGSPDSTRPQLHGGDLMQLNIVANRSWPNQILEPNPDPRVAPSVTNGVDCTSGNCVVSQGSMFSRLWIQSFRGAPSLFANGNIPFVVLKFGNVV